MSVEQSREEQLEALRCGRTQPPMHLVEADAYLTRVWWVLGRDRVALCGAVLTEETEVPDFEDCPGCRDCTRYCAKCAREVARFAIVETPAGEQDGDGPTGYVLVGDCPHPVAGGPAFHVGPCPECERAERRQQARA